MEFIDEIRYLEGEGVFIHIQHEHYKNGSNCNWSVEFTKFEQRNNQTSWFGDNHEFGDTIDCYAAAFRIAHFLLKDDNLKWYFLEKIETVTDEGRANYSKHRKVREEAHKAAFNKK